MASNHILPRAFRQKAQKGAVQRLVGMGVKKTVARIFQSGVLVQGRKETIRKSVAAIGNQRTNLRIDQQSA
jgi:hypothetical protein